MSHHHRRAAAVSAPDPYFSSTVLLLTGNGTNGGQNNTFLDSSTNNFTITRNGNTTQGSFSPFGWQWSNYFDGNGDYLSIADNAAFELGSGDFTVECWIYLTGYSAAYSGTYLGAVITKDSSASRGFEFRLEGTASSWTKIVGLLFSSNSTFTATEATATFSLNTWYHLAWVRSGTSLRMYVNGIDVGGGTNSINVQDSTTAVTIGATSYTGYQAYFPGYISSLRFIKGAAQYTSNFTPSTTPLTAITNTQLLTCQSNRFVDNSTNAFTITRNGDVAVSNFAPFPAGEYAASVEGGSGYFDGTGDYLTFPGITLSGDFCCECWYYRTANSTNYSVIFGGSSVSGANNNQFYVTNTGGLSFVLSATGIINNAGTAFVNNTWNHLAYVRNGTNCAVFVNGVRQGTGTSSIATSVCSRIGDIAGLAGYQPIGNISNARIVSGSSVYDPTQTTLTVPANPLTAITNTQLLLNFTNGSIVDATGKNDLETVGNAQVSTSVKKYGTGSLLFDGASDSLFMRYTTDFFLQTSYTIEAWIYPTTTSGYRPIFTIEPTSGANFGALILAQNGTAINGECRPTTGGTNVVISGGTLTANQWFHVALSVSSGSAKLYLDGSQVGTTSTFTNFSFTPVGVAVGANANQYNFTTQVFLGNIDDLRVTKGIARYTSNFTPPYRQLPTR